MIFSRFTKNMLSSILSILLISNVYATEQNTPSIVHVVKELHVTSLDLPSEIAKPTIISEKDKKN